MKNVLNIIIIFLLIFLLIKLCTKRQYHHKPRKPKVQNVEIKSQYMSDDTNSDIRYAETS